MVSVPTWIETGAVATMAAVEMTVPVEAADPARASCWTVKLNCPAEAFELAVAVTAELEDVAFMAVHPAGRASSCAFAARAANLVLSVW
ncbi:hypothetical protein D3C83_100130 [compost metagenome]